MPEHMTREKRVLYDHATPDAPRRQADDWGIDESCRRVTGRRFAGEGRAQQGPARSRRGPVEDWGVDQAFDPQAAPDPEELVAAAESARANTVELEVVELPAPEVVTEGRRTIRIHGR